MPIHSQYPPITVSPLDLWAFFFDNADREFPDDHVVYVDTAANKRLAFRNIQATAEQFGQGLLANWGWQRGDILALITPNSVNVASVTCGALYAGGVVCALNHLSTAVELAQSLKASNAKALVTNFECLEAVREAANIVGMSNDRILLIDETDSKHEFQHFTSIRSSFPRLKRPEIKPERDLAFLVYSSGTTGLPKGVMLTHANITANLLQTTETEGNFSHWTRDKSLGFLPMYHIYGMAVLVLSPLYRGVTTFIMQRFDLNNFCRIVQDDGITIAYIVPPVALALAKSPLVDNYNLESLRMLNSAAAPAPKEVIEGIYRRLGVPTKQAYGLTEASPAVASQAAEEWNKPIGSSGRLTASMSMKVIQDGQEMGRGKTGEIWLRGPNIFKGYYNNPTATSDAIDAGGWYRTGDIGHVDENDNIFITDRLKELIKYNGFQVPPAQLEALLLKHPAVADVAVIGIYAAARATELPRAYIVLAGGLEGDEKMEQDLHEWFNKQVVPHKRLRGGIRFVMTIPKSNTGKILRRVLMEEAKKEQEGTPVKALL
ncbi:hypothetical protein C7974DRAFT_453371 [Boeremia exigua]|uniref:uncharacterized protein n=1 Tax=Boeremia exigua TaxID=749465 RepID=UPI001E8D9F31|nr:uncharacterized protein C7974DRAFT_453371 [Boeremia exigua]KAH6633806.1 hypothetical protein C7974DRAFT_453371 [Boeremia exigua]